jgi:hypothetical protein
MEGGDWAAAGVTTSKQIDAKNTTHLTMCTDMFLLLDSMEKYYERSGGKKPSPSSRNIRRGMSRRDRM